MMQEWSRDLVSAVIASYDKWDLLGRLLLSLQRQGYQEMEKIVVLNNYPQEKVEDLRRNFPKAIFIVNKENLFYCRAQNQGIRIAKGEFVLCLNDDLLLKEDFVAEMVKAAKKDKQIGMVSGCIMRQDRKSVDTAGLLLARSRKPHERGFGRRHLQRYQTAQYIFGSGGAAALYRRRMLEDTKIGNEYFDEDYDVFYEDLDICWRAQNRQWKGYYTPTALGFHFRGATTKKTRPKFSFLQTYNFPYLSQELKLRLIKNRYMTIIKNDKLPSFLRDLPWFLTYELKLWLYIIVFEPVLILRFFRGLGFIRLAWCKRRKISAR